jgi:hypothetical protein
MGSAWGCTGSDTPERGDSSLDRTASWPAPTRAVEDKRKMCSPEGFWEKIEQKSESEGCRFLSVQDLSEPLKEVTRISSTQGGGQRMTCFCLLWPWNCL